MTQKKVLVKSSCIIHGQHGDLFIELHMETCVEKRSWDVKRVSVTSDFMMARLKSARDDLGSPVHCSFPQLQERVAKLLKYHLAKSNPHGKLQLAANRFLLAL